MKNLITLIMAVLSFSMAHAQEKCQKGGKRQDHPQGKHQMNPDRDGKKKMMESIGLTDEQKSKMKAIHEESRKKMEALKQQQSLTIKEFNDKKTAIRNEMKAKREALLTKEQKDKIASMKSDMERKKEEINDKKLAKMKEKLSLSDDQIKQMNAIRQKTKSDINAIKNNSKLNDEEKKSQIKTLVKNSRDARMNVLTKEQLIKMANSPKHRAKDKSAIKK